MTCTYINISVKNFTGLESLSTYTLDVTPLTFVASLSSNNLFISDKKGFWNLGDGTVSTSLSTTHYYSWPGTYDVTFYAFTSAGDAMQACQTFQVTAFNYIGDYLQSSYLDNEKISSIKSGQVSDAIEFSRFNSWQSYPSVSATGYTLNFYASGSKSDYLQIENYIKDPWAHLQSYFFFVQKRDNRFGILSSATTTADPIYVYISNNQIVETSYPYPGSTLAGTSGTTTVYYVDQFPKNLTSETPIFLFASLDISKFPSRNETPNLNYTENYSNLSHNNFSSVVTPVKNRYNPAEVLSITSNGIDGEGYPDETFYINKIKWQNYPVSFLIKLKDTQNYSTKYYPLLTFNKAGGQTSASTIFYVTHAETGSYLVNGISNPSLNLQRGATYIFNINASGHPFWIKTIASTGTGNQYNSGVTNNGGSTGQIIFNVPCDAPSTLYYACQFHNTMQGVLNITGSCTTQDFDLTCNLISVCSQKVIDGIEFYKNNNVKNITRTGGFYAGYFNSPYALENVALTASVTVTDPAFFEKDSPYSWVGQGLDSYSVSITSNQAIASNIYRYNKFRNYDACGDTLALQLTANSTSPTVFAGVLKNPFAIAVSPSEDDAVWFADSDRDRILKLKENGEVIFDIDLSNAPRIDAAGNVVYYNYQGAVSGATPSSIALDGQANAWITLYTSGSCIRIQRDTGYVDAEAYPRYPNVNFSILNSFSAGPIESYLGVPIEIFLEYSTPALSGLYTNESTILPTCIETDLDSNIWVTYSNPLKGYLIKFDTNGNFLAAKEFPTLFSPQQLLIDRDNNLYMTVMTYLNNNSSITNRNDFLYKYASNTGVLDSNYPLSGYSGLGPLAVDKDQYVYGLFNKQDIFRVKTGTDVTTFSVGSGTNLTTEYQSIESLACDTENILWLVHNFDKKIYLYPLNQFTVLNTVDVNRINTDDVNPCNLRAYGDWTGMRWINKYYYNTRTRTITGQSNTFSIYPVSGAYGISKINENFNPIENIKSYILQESLLNKNVLFDQFLGPIVGNKKSQVNSLGKRIYEKITNFVLNNSDLDADELSALQSMESTIGVDLQNYNYPFPPDMQRLINLFSTKLSYFRGSPNQFSSNYDKKQTISNSNYGKNLGAKLSWFTSTVPTSGKIVLYERFGEVYSEGILTNYGVLTNSFLSGSTQVVHLSDVNVTWGWPLVVGDGITGTEVSRYYDIYAYNGGANNLFYNNLIDWTDSKTTINQTNSAYSDWFNTNNIVDSMINYQLSVGLGLLSADN